MMYEMSIENGARLIWLYLQLGTFKREFNFIKEKTGSSKFLSEAGLLEGEKPG